MNRRELLLGGFVAAAGGASSAASDRQSVSDDFNREKLAQTNIDLTQVPFALRGVSGAAGRPILAKLSDIVSVKDFGAVGDGNIDNTQAVQRAIDSFPTGRGS